jgi:hypothetical protein
MALAASPDEQVSHTAPGAKHRRGSRQRAAVLARVLRSNEFQQTVLVVCAFFAYFAVRGFTQGSHVAAVDHARAVADLERRLGFYWEPWLQEQMIGHSWLVTGANWIYIWGHWPVIAAVAIWLVIRRPATFRLFRNAFFISGAIGITIFVIYPVAPPRLAGAGLIDTVTLHSHSYRVLQPPAFVNQYAAVPSLHFGWDLLIGIAVVREMRWWPLRVLGVIVPALMLWAIVVTANHYIFDAGAGAAVALLGLALAYEVGQFVALHHRHAMHRARVASAA